MQLHLPAQAKRRVARRVAVWLAMKVRTSGLVVNARQKRFDLSDDERGAFQDFDVSADDSDSADSRGTRLPNGAAQHHHHWFDELRREVR